MRFTFKHEQPADKQTKTKTSFCLFPKKLSAVNETTYLWLHKLKTTYQYNLQKNKWIVAMYEYK